MLKNTKTAAILFAFILIFGLFGCTTAPADDNWFEDSAVVNTVYTKEELAKTETSSTNDVFGAAENWAKKFVEENYKSHSPFDITTGFVSGGNTVPSVFTGMDTVFSTMSYYVRFSAQTPPKDLTADENGQYGLHLQMVMKNDGENKLTLLGFVTNQTRQITRPGELAQFLKTVPEYENVQVMKPVTENPVEAINLADKTGGLRIINFVPAGDTLYVLGTDPDYRMAGKGTDVTQADGVLKVFSAENLNLLYEYNLTIDFTKVRFLPLTAKMSSFRRILRMQTVTIPHQKTV